MSASVILQGFAYGECLDDLPQRSLGFRLLAPAEPEPWCPEVEALARLLQTAPYPDHWPPADLFCSVLLADGRRVVAVARYGLCDQTPSQRRGGIELFGVVGPGSLDPPAALAVYHWLRQCRSKADDLRAMGGQYFLADILPAECPPPAAGAPPPVLPVRLWQDGTLLFAAAAPTDPDRHLALLDGRAVPNWQWLPLVAPDFPFPAHARRGPLVAWVPNLAGLAVKLDGHPPAPVPRPVPSRHALLAVFGFLLLGLLAANLWATFSLPARLPSAAPAAPAPEAHHSSPVVVRESDASREEFARALYRLLLSEAPSGEFKRFEDRFLKRYRSLLAHDKDLHVDGNDGKAVVAALAILARRRIDRIEALIREALASSKGFDPQLAELACRRVRERLAQGIDDGPP